GPPGGGAGARAVQRKPLVPKDAVDAKADDVNSDRGDQTKAAHLAEKDGANNPVGGGFRKVYQAGGLEVLAFLPDAGIDKPDDLRVFTFFHGDGADFGGKQVDQFGESADNPAQGIDLARAV